MYRVLLPGVFYSNNLTGVVQDEMQLCLGAENQYNVHDVLYANVKQRQFVLLAASGVKLMMDFMCFVSNSKRAKAHRSIDL